MSIPACHISIQSLTEAMVKELHSAQLQCWPLASANFSALASVEQRKVDINGVPFVVQHNPARAVSTGAKIDATSIARRKCFLCSANRPAEQLQITLAEGYHLLVNPYPIFPLHFTIPAIEHTPQIMLDRNSMESRFPTCGTSVSPRLKDMMKLAQALPSFVIFYNGPTSGASAPDHFHFQAVERSRLPLFSWIKEKIVLPYRIYSELFTAESDAEAWLREKIGDASGNELPMNLFAASAADGVRLVVVPRAAHRPSNYGTAPGEILVSPGAIDVAGTIIAPRALDYHTNLTPTALGTLLSAVCLPA